MGRGRTVGGDDEARNLQRKGRMSVFWAVRPGGNFDARLALRRERMSISIE